MWNPVIRYFEFSYFDGLSFWDRSGRTTSDLMQAIPGLQLKNRTLDQVELTNHTPHLELVFGISTATVRSVSPDARVFHDYCKQVLEILGKNLELQTIVRWKMQIAFGWRCENWEQAGEVIKKFLPPEVQQIVDSGGFQAAQLETIRDGVRVTPRFALVELHSPVEVTAPAKPHAAVTQTLESVENLPMSVDIVSKFQDLETAFLAELKKHTDAPKQASD